MTGNATFASFEISGGARIDRIPLEAFPGFWAYVYLVSKDGLRVLIDCGSGTETSHTNLLDGLGQAGCQPGDLTHILLTHAHIDHYGGLSQLKPLTQAKIGVHELDLQTVSYHEARLALIGGRLDSFLAGAGLADETREQLLSIYRFTKSIYRSVPVDFTYEAADMRLGPFDLIHLPGHCPGQVAIRLDDLVFCGDMVLEGVTPHLSPESINLYSGLDHYLESLNLFQRWAKDARLIFNGHDDVITDLPGRAEGTRQNLIRRLSRALDALEKPLTVAEVTQAVYGEMGGYNALLVIEKTGAYVEYLYEHGMIEITNPGEVEQGKPARYRRLRQVSDSEILPKERAYVFV
ncbi:MAG TPA: MBL fold metallo-hydrolase [Anaerolineales bacterium]|nr:MBL fold metallo-hydrolase [Anaerolineales bacterium]